MELANGMQYNSTMSALEKANAAQEAKALNEKNFQGRKVGQSLDKNDFLTILIKQLQTQDPTDPLKDRDFVAQMAQFSSLEQMTNMSTNFEKLQGVLSGSQAVQTLGKEVQIFDSGAEIKGVVKEVTAGNYPQVFVNGKFYDYSQVQKILVPEAN